MSNQPQNLEFTMPSWLAGYICEAGALSSAVDRMSFVVEVARCNIERGTGGPFGAAVFERDTGVLVALGVNLVTSCRCSLLHAEMVAIAMAQRKLGEYDLGAPGLPPLQLVTTCEPCAMCLGAIPWSGVRSVISGATDADARAIGFDEGPKVPDWVSALAARGIAVETEVERKEARSVLLQYRDSGGAIYNGRRDGV